MAEEKNTKKKKKSKSSNTQEELIKKVEANEKAERKQILKFRWFVCFLVVAILAFLVVVTQIILMAIKLK